MNQPFRQVGSEPISSTNLLPLRVAQAKVSTYDFVDQIYKIIHPSSLQSLLLAATYHVAHEPDSTAFPRWKPSN